MKKALLVGCLLGIALLVLSGGVFLFTQVPSVADQLPAESMPLLVTLSLPANESTVPLDQLTTITGEAIGGRPIAALELWIDGALKQKTSPPPGVSLTQFAAFWTWTPPSAGEYTLLIRARDANEAVAQSNVVRVIAAKAEPGVVRTDYVPQPGESVPAVAVKFKTSPQTILDLNPQINPTNPLPPNQPINVPIPVPNFTPPDVESTAPPPPPLDAPPAPPSDPSTPAPGSPAPWWFWIKNFFKADKLPSAPSLWAKTENCNIRLTIKDDAAGEDGFFIYRMGPAAVAFERIATLDAHTSPGPFDYVDSDVMSGEWQYFITAFNTKGEAPSGIVKVDLSGPVECAKLLEPTLGLKQGKLTFTQKVDKAYCYVAVNDSKWTRVPPAPGTFIFPDKNGAFDVSPWVNQFPPGDVKLGIECWGWQGAALEYLGQTEQTFKKGQKGLVEMAVAKLHFTGELDNLPVLKPVKGGDEKIWLAPPADLKLTGNAKVCTDHMPGILAVFGGGALLCQEAIKDTYAVLVWNWQAGFCPLGAGCVLAGKPDGYRVYRESFPTPYLFKDVKGDQLTLAMFPFPAPPWAPPANPTWIQKIQYELETSRCYSVRAYKKTAQGIIESEDSSKLCLGNIETWKVTTLKPSASLRRFREHYESCVDDFWTAPPLNKVPGAVAAGFEHFTGECNTVNFYLRGAVWFDLSQVPMPITYASLKYKFVDGEDTSVLPNKSNSKVSCAYYLMLGTEDWRGNPYGDKPISIPAQDYTYIGYGGTVEPGQPFWTDVTTVVKEWLGGTRPNFGFVLRGSDEILAWEENKACASVYDDFELVIQHYGQ